MSFLQYHDNILHVENVSLKNVAEKYGTPCYIYSRSALEKNWHTFNHAFDTVKHRICYAVKANGNIAILNLLAKLNSGFDIVSMGELERVIAAGGDPKQIIFSGVGKNEIEIKRAIEIGIFCFNVESEAELDRLSIIASKLKKIVSIALRINPNVNPGTHSYISTGLKENKFGINANEVIPLCHKLLAMPSLKLIGIACHIGSQIVELQPFLSAIDQMLEVNKQLQTLGMQIQHVNIGGGLGITYHQEHPPTITNYVKTIREKLSNSPLEIIIEPGRSIIGNAGILLTRIEYLKHTPHKNFAIVDAGMNDLLRPALYHAWQTILTVHQRNDKQILYDVAGPLCESADFLGKDRSLAIQPNDLLAIDSAGAYGFSMSSNYNARCRPAEIIIDGNQMHLVRKRETIKDLFTNEMIPAW